MTQDTTAKDTLTYLVRAPNWVGDAVMATPFFSSLRANAPHDVIICLCHRHIAPIYETHPAVDEVVGLVGNSSDAPVSFIWKNGLKLSQRTIDCAFCLPNSFSSAMILKLAGAKRRIGYSADARSLLLTDTLPFGANGKRPHRVEGYLNLLQVVFPHGDFERHVRVVVPDDAVEILLERWPSTLGGPALALAPGAAQENKMWETERFISLAHHWLADDSKNVLVLVGSQSEHELCQRVVVGTGEFDRVVDLSGQGDLIFTAAAIKRCTVFCGNDSGLSHLAAAVGTPVVSISGPGDPNEVSPYTDRQETVIHDVFCKPCYKNVCWRKDRPLECLNGIDVEHVWKAIERMRQLASKAAHSNSAS